MGRVVAGALGRLLVFAALLAALLWRLLIAWTSVPIQVGKTLPDDAFYYFRIAQHVARGAGVTFDRLTPTNGFHPLWLAAIAPIFWLLDGNAELPIHVALTCANLLNIGTAVVAYLIARQLSGSTRAGVVALVLYAFNAPVVIESVNGLETALSNLLVAILAWHFVRTQTWRGPAGLALGALAGTAILARTDNAFFLAAIVLTVVSEAPSVATGLRAAVALGLGAAVVVAPWLLWSRLVTGSTIQSSGLAVPFVMWGNIRPDLGTESAMGWVAGQTLDALRMALRFSGAPWPPLPFVLIGAALIITIVTGDRRLQAAVSRLNFLVVALVGLVLFHGAYRLYPRTWYFMPLALLSALYLSLLLDYVARLFRAPVVGDTIAAAAVAVLIASNVLQFRAVWRAGVYPWQAEMLTAAHWIGQNTNELDRIGSFNAGIIGYWNPQHTVINLDGVVNAPAFDAIRQRRLWEYIDGTQIRYLVDYESFFWASPADFSGSYASYFGVPLVHKVHLVERFAGGAAESEIVVLRTQ